MLTSLSRRKLIALTLDRTVANFSTKSDDTAKSAIRGLGAIYSDFPKHRPVNIWTWNVNGISSVMEKGIFQQFMSNHNPMVLCLNETKTSVDKIDEKMLHANIPSGYK